MRCKHGVYVLDNCEMCEEESMQEEIINLRAEVDRLNKQVDSLKGENRKHRADKKELQSMLETNRADSIKKHNDIVLKFKLEEYRLREKAKEPRQ
jgi:peptidoglycan hydrolase CwlO-like protein